MQAKTFKMSKIYLIDFIYISVYDNFGGLGIPVSFPFN